jgi:hypothetical protein
LNPSFDKNIKKSKSRRGEIFSFFSFLKWFSGHFALSHTPQTLRRIFPSVWRFLSHRVKAGSSDFELVLNYTRRSPWHEVHPHLICNAQKFSKEFNTANEMGVQ